MCTTPLLIRNRKFNMIDVNIKSSFTSVPCGQCDECLRSRANDLYVRARYEFDACLSAGGCGFMCCLTYDDSQVPTIEVLGKKYMVFNKKHVQDFIKRLRTNLDRYFKKHFGRSAPAFKYLITCEYGSDPTRSHRPHYHILIFFMEFIGIDTFRKNFVLSCSYFDKKKQKRVAVFGRIYQCDLLDPKRGGIKYSGKYILKDLMFENQRKYINERIKFATEYVNTKFNINSLPLTASERFRNKCIRTSKAYRQAIGNYVRPYRHMLQFYMLSNDLGISAIIRKYGESVVNMPCLNFDGFPFSLPKQVKERLARDYGNEKSDELAKRIFTNYAERALSDLQFNGKLDSAESAQLMEFIDKFIFPLYGNLYLVNPLGLNIREHLENGSSLADWDLLLNDFQFFSDNDLFQMRNRLLKLLALYDSEDNRLFRAKLAKERTEKEREKYETKKRNNSYKY